MLDNVIRDDNIFFADERIHQEFIDVYAGLYASKERYVDVVKAFGGGQFYGMTQKELSSTLAMKSGGTLSKLLDNLIESGIIRSYPRYGKERLIKGKGEGSLKFPAGNG